MEALTESFVFYAAERFDMVGKLLKANRKLYMVVLSTRPSPFKNKSIAYSFIILLFLQINLHHRILLIRQGIAVRRIGIEEEKGILVIFLQVPVMGFLNLGIIG